MDREVGLQKILATRICDLALRPEGTLAECVEQVIGELREKGITFVPAYYLGEDDFWTADRAVSVNIPWYLANPTLWRLVNDHLFVYTREEVLMYLRHEAGHAINYAYRLHAQPEWAEMFGPFKRPYRDSFRPDPSSRQFVRHIVSHQYGRTYAQKHPDEDFAETFAVWLTPRSGWRRRYRNWPALRKLQYLDKLMRRIRTVTPHIRRGELCTPVEKMTMLLAEHYGQRAERYRAAAQGYVDDKLHEIFPPPRGRARAAAAELLQKHHAELVERVRRWSGLPEEEVRTLLSKLEDRAEALGLQYRSQQMTDKLLDLTSLATSLAMDFAYTGRFTG